MGSCPNCCTRGFRSNKPAYLYLHRLIHISGLVFYKFGITNREPLDRVKQQASKFSGHCNLLFTRRFGVGLQALALESKIKKIAKGGCVSKSILPDGFTETFIEEDLGEIMNIMIKGEAHS